MRMSHRIEDVRNRSRTAARKCRGLGQMLSGQSSADANIAAVRLDQAVELLDRILARGPQA